MLREEVYFILYTLITASRAQEILKLQHRQAVFSQLSLDDFQIPKLLQLDPAFKRRYLRERTPRELQTLFDGEDDSVSTLEL